MEAKQRAWKVTKCQELACLLCQTSAMAKAEEGLPTSRNRQAARLLAPCMHVDGFKEKLVISGNNIFKTVLSQVLRPWGSLCERVWGVEGSGLWG